MYMAHAKPDIIGINSFRKARPDGKVEFVGEDRCSGGYIRIGTKDAQYQYDHGITVYFTVGMISPDDAIISRSMHRDSGCDFMDLYRYLCNKYAHDSCFLWIDEIFI